MIKLILFNTRNDFIYIYDGDFTITPQTKEMVEVTGNAQERFLSRSNTIYLSFYSAGSVRISSSGLLGSGFNISVNTGKSFN